ncbi:hypothetical protein CBL_03512 [Carabus blaptoides fortunei]
MEAGNEKGPITNILNAYPNKSIGCRRRHRDATLPRISTVVLSIRSAPSRFMIHGPAQKTPGPAQQYFLISAPNTGSIRSQHNLNHFANLAYNSRFVHVYWRKALVRNLDACHATPPQKDGFHKELVYGISESRENYSGS